MQPIYGVLTPANIIALFALLVSMLNVFLWWSNERSKRSETTPDVSSQIRAIKDRPCWFVIKIKARNVLPVEVDVMRVTLIGPQGVFGLNEEAATRVDGSGSRRLLRELPTEGRKTIGVSIKLAPAGTQRRDTDWFSIYVKSESPGEITFAVSCCVRKSDTKRMREMVSVQRVNVMASLN